MSLIAFKVSTLGFCARGKDWFRVATVSLIAFRVSTLGFCGRGNVSDCIHGHDVMMVPGPWSLRGPWSLVPGPWSLVAGPWSLGPGPWSLVLRDPWPLAPYGRALGAPRV